jgi:hypothetical protein
MDSHANQSNPPGSSREQEEPETSQMAAVPSAQPEVVWPEDPFAEGDGREESPRTSSPGSPPWQEPSFGEPPAPPESLAAKPADDDPRTAPFPAQPAIAPWQARSDSDVGKTQPPMPPRPIASAAEDGGTEDTKPPVPAAPAAEESPVGAEPEASTGEAEAAAEPAAAPEAAEVESSEPVTSEQPALEAEPRVDEPASEPDMPATAPPVPEPLAPATPEPAAVEPAAPVAAREPAKPAEPPMKPDFATSSATASASNPPIPAWAPKLDAPAAQPQGIQWPGSNLPSWAPIAGGQPAAGAPERVRISSTPQPAAPAPAPNPPVQAPAPPQAPTPQVLPQVAPQPAPAPAAPRPPAPAPTASNPPKATSSSWQIVEQKRETEPAFTGPSAEDKSYAEWFAWAKRSGAPASACHAAAQGAFRALSSGQDMATAVKWATVAMASPPGLVGQARQLYCAWFSLGNIDLQLPTPTAHAFATGAIQALESGADSMVAHQAGLAAAGITGR